MVKLYEAGHIDLLFADETGFSLKPYIPYGWQPIGVQTSIPTSRTHVINIFGLMSIDNRLRFYPTKDNIDSEFIIKCLDDYANKIAAEDSPPSVIIWDNASWHKSQMVLDKREEWEQKGLYLFFQPTYSPHLNKAETLWRMVKYKWLKPQDYKSTKTLKKAVMRILTQFGSKYSINFSMNY